jgi:hypothetical protein
MHAELRGASTHLWAVPAQLIGSTALTDRKCLLEELDSLVKRDLVDRLTFPTYTSYVELKSTLSDLEVVLTKLIPMPALCFQSLGIFGQLQLTKLILVIWFVGSKLVV